MTAADIQAWERAEKIAAEYAVAHGAPPQDPVVARHVEVPYLFQVDLSPPGLLVHRGRVVTERGAAALRAYLAESRLLAGDLPDALEVATLVETLDFLPDTRRYDRVAPTSYWTPSDDHPPLHPRIQRDRDRIELRLCYPEAGRTFGDDDDEDEDIMHVVQWTLILEPDQDPLWTRTARRYSRARDAWID